MTTWEARDYEISEAARMIARSVGVAPEQLVRVEIEPQGVTVTHRAQDASGALRVVDHTFTWKWVP